MKETLHAQVTELLDGTHCPRHGMEWEACCLAEVLIDVHNKVMVLLATARKEAREAAFSEALETVKAKRSKWAQDGAPSDRLIGADYIREALEQAAATDKENENAKRR